MFCRIFFVLNLPVGLTIAQIHSDSETKQLVFLHSIRPTACALRFSSCPPLLMPWFSLHMLPLSILRFCLIRAGLVIRLVWNAGPLP